MISILIIYMYPMYIYIYIYGGQAIGVWIQQSQGRQVNNLRGRVSHVMKHIYILYENK
jgi:hypothetical protein